MVDSLRVKSELAVCCQLQYAFQALIRSQLKSFLMRKWMVKIVVGRRDDDGGKPALVLPALDRRRLPRRSVSRETAHSPSVLRPFASVPRFYDTRDKPNATYLFPLRPNVSISSTAVGYVPDFRGPVAARTGRGRSMIATEDMLSRKGCISSAYPSMPPI